MMEDTAAMADVPPTVIRLLPQDQTLREPSVWSYLLTADAQQLAIGFHRLDQRLGFGLTLGVDAHKHALRPDRL